MTWELPGLYRWGAMAHAAEDKWRARALRELLRSSLPPSVTGGSRLTSYTNCRVSRNVYSAFPSCCYFMNETISWSKLPTSQWIHLFEHAAYQHVNGWLAHINIIIMAYYDETLALKTWIRSLVVWTYFNCPLSPSLPLKPNSHCTTDPCRKNTVTHSGVFMFVTCIVTACWTWTKNFTLDFPVGRVFLSAHSDS